MSTPSPVAVSREGAVGIVELARPEKFNSLSLAVHRGIDAALTQFEAADSGVRVVLICAQGKHFSTGADLEEVKAWRFDPPKLEHYTRFGHSVLKRLEGSDLPVIAACQGLALAGGSELMLACDVVIASSDFRVGDQHAQYGLIPGWGGSQRIPRIVGLRRGLDLLFSARWVDAPTALQWGLVNYVVEPDQLRATALNYCTKLATRSRPGIAMMKRLARQGLDGTLEQGLDLEMAALVDTLLGADVAEGLAAFEERRAPVYKA